MERWPNILSLFFPSVPIFSPTAFISYLLPQQARKLPPYGYAYGNPRQGRPQDGRVGTTSEWHPGQAHTFRRQCVRGSAVQVQHVSGVSQAPRISGETAWWAPRHVPVFSIVTCNPCSHVQWVSVGPDCSVSVRQCAYASKT